MTERQSGRATERQSGRAAERQSDRAAEAEVDSQAPTKATLLLCKHLPQAAKEEALEVAKEEASSQEATR